MLVESINNNINNYNEYQYDDDVMTAFPMSIDNNSVFNFNLNDTDSLYIL